ARILESHTEPRPTLMASPPSPANCCTTFPATGSIREIGNSNDVTHTEPSPNAISPPGPGTPTSTVSTTLFVFGSTLDTSPLVLFMVHINTPPIVRKRGALPTGMLSTTRFVSGFTRVSTLDSVPVTQTAPSPKATVNEPGGTWTSATTLFVTGSIRDRVPFVSVIS